MTVDNLIDTLLNLVVFAFIGWLIWLYFKPAAPDTEHDETKA